MCSGNTNDPSRMYGDRQNNDPRRPPHFAPYNLRNHVFGPNTAPVIREQYQVLDLRVRVPNSNWPRRERVNSNSSMIFTSMTQAGLENYPTIYRRPEMTRSATSSPSSSLPSSSSRSSNGDYNAESAQHSRPASVRTERSSIGGSDLESSRPARDEAYYIRRRKNNLAAKRSRDAKRKREAEIRAQLLRLQAQNHDLLGLLRLCSCRHIMANPVYRGLYLFCNN